MVQNADRVSQPLFSQYASPTDWPWTLTTVVSEARRIISYMENLPDEAKPPQSIWHSPFKCMAWIKSHHPAYKGKQESAMLEFDDFEVERANG